MAKIGYSFGALVDVYNNLDATTVKLSGTQTIAGNKTFSGQVGFQSPTALTQSTSDSSTKVATTAYVKNQGYVTSSGNTVIGTDTDTTFSGAKVLNALNLTNGVITSYSSRTMTLANLGYTGAANANYYVHPSYSGDDAAVDTGALSGATVISDLDFNVTTDSLGHVTDANATVATRNLTLANLGYTGATNANYITNNNQLSNGAGYVTNSGNTVIGTGTDVNTSGSTIIDSIYVTDGVITSMGTRTLTAANIGASTGATVTSSGSNSNGYYRIWSDGYKECWRQGTMSKNSTITFPVAFTTTASVGVMCSHFGTTSDNYYDVYARSVTISNFYLTGNVYQGTAYYAKGY